MDIFRKHLLALTGLLTAGTLTPAAPVNAALTIELAAMDGRDGFFLNGDASGDVSGKSVALIGDVNFDGIADLVIGSPGDAGDDGSAHIIYGTSGGFPRQFDLSAVNGHDGDRIFNISPNAEAGTAVSSAGDFNGDGLSDLAIGAPMADPGALTDSGQVYVLFGRPNQPSTVVPPGGGNGITITGHEDGDELGSSVANAGDVNGDGIDDLIIGAPGVTTRRRVGQTIFEFPNAGRSYVVYGTDQGLPETFEINDLDGSNGFLLSGLESGDRSGYSVDGGGDFNGDGLADIVIGAPFANSNASDSGTVYVVFGSSTAAASSVNLAALNGTNGLVLNGNSTNAQTGFVVRFTGDINGDGFDDLGIGGSSSYILYGSDSGFPAVIELALLDGTSGFEVLALYGSLGRAGDVNGDGTDDLLIGDPANSTGFLVFGRSDGFPALLDPFTLSMANVTRLFGQQASQLLGFEGAISGGHDLNADGIHDIVIGAPGMGGSISTPARGGAYVVFGNAAPIVSGSQAQLFDELEDDPFAQGSRVDIALAQHYLDNDPMAGLAVVADASTPEQGQWQFSSDAVNWDAFPNNLGDDNAQVIAATDRLRFRPAADFAGQPGPLTVRLWDGRQLFSGVGRRNLVGSVGGLGGFSNDANLLQVTVTIEEVNDPPTFVAASPPPVNEDPGGVSIAGWASFEPGPPSEAGQIALAWQVENISNPGLFSVLPTIGTLGNLVYNPAPDVSGSSSFDVRVVDNGGIANGGVDASDFQTFVITVNPVNDPPGFVASDPPPVPVDSGPQLLANWAAADPGAFDETDQTVTLNVVGVDNPQLFAQPPVVDADGNLLYTPAAAASGTSTFQVIAQDDGGVANGGQDTSPVQTFTIEIRADLVFANSFEQ